MRITALLLNWKRQENIVKVIHDPMTTLKVDIEDF